MQLDNIALIDCVRSCNLVKDMKC